MEVDVLLFAAPREIVGRARTRVAIAAPATAASVLDALVALHPALAPWRGRVALAVNRAVVPATAPVREGDEVALIPPVSGGSGRFTEEPPSLDAEVAGLAKAGAGAVVCFLGLVRSPAPEGEVTHLDFEAYAAMAEREIADVAARARAKFGLVDARLVHRLGRVGAEQPVVLVAVSAPHRREAFEAAQWIMDELKTVVPVWKKEAGPWGERWVHAEGRGRGQGDEA